MATEGFRSYRKKLVCVMSTSDVQMLDISGIPGHMVGRRRTDTNLVLTVPQQWNLCRCHKESGTIGEVSVLAIL